MLGLGGGPVDLWGVAASLGAMVASSFGYILTVAMGFRHPGDHDVVVAAPRRLGASDPRRAPRRGGAARAHARPPRWASRTSPSIATAVAYVAWFTGLRRLPAGVVGVVGLLNPVTGVVLGVALAGEAFGLAQGVGLALVLGGVALGSLPPIRRRRAVTPPITGSRSASR